MLNKENLDVVHKAMNTDLSGLIQWGNKAGGLAKTPYHAKPFDEKYW